MSLDDNGKFVRSDAFVAHTDEVLAELADKLIRKKPPELEKGKAGIIVPSKDELPKVLDLIIEAVTQGELDDLLASLARSRLSVKSKDAATPGQRSGATKR